MISITILEWIGFIGMMAHALGFITAVHAIMTARTSQGAIAWALLLILFPWDPLESTCRHASLSIL